MKPVLTVLALAMLLAPAAAEAKNDRNRGKPAGPAQHATSRTGCPPGLAKKDPPCVPPGLAKATTGGGDDGNHDDFDGRGYVIGDVIDRDYELLQYPEFYGLDPDQTYYRVGPYLYRVDRDTAEVLDFIGAFTALLD